MKLLRPFLFARAAVTGLFLIASGAVQFAQDCSYTWTAQSSGTTNILYTVKAVSPQICWTAGANATVRRTTDGGSTWLNANPNPGVIAGTIDNMEAIDGNTAWVSVSTSFNTFIYKTTNGGTNWFQVYTASGRFINGIRMITASSGIAVGDPSANVWTILLTSDGGNSWQLSPNAPSAQISETGNSNSFQVSLPNMWFGTSLTTVYRSTDGGVTWSSHSTPGAGIYVFSLHFNSGTIGHVAGTSMSRSTNGGFTYQSHPSMGAGNIDGIEGSGSDFWYIRGEHFYRSTNDGINWSQVHTAPLTQKHIDFPDNLTGCQMGWSVGYGGTISKMTGSVVSSGNNGNNLPEQFELLQNYPNPFNPNTKIYYELPENTFVRITVFDLNGKEIELLVDHNSGPGKFETNWNAEGYSSGVYFYTLETKSFTKTRKMVLLK